jgi:hypothetical protein
VVDSDFPVHPYLTPDLEIEHPHLGKNLPKAGFYYSKRHNEVFYLSAVDIYSCVRSYEYAFIVARTNNSSLYSNKPPKKLALMALSRFNDNYKRLEGELAEHLYG